MSAWPEAVWIVKKMQENFDFENLLQQYKNDVNAYLVASNIDYLINKYNILLDDVNENILNKTMTYTASSFENRDNPESPEYIPEEQLANGVICLIIEQQQQ